MKLHWSSRYGRSGEYVGTLNQKLLDDHQHLLAQVTVVASGLRSHVQIHDGKFHDVYWSRSFDFGVGDVKCYFGIN